jgi:translation initiation factor IF-1
MSKKRDNNIKKAPKVFVEKDDDHEYAFVIKKLGGGRFTVKLNMQSREIIGRICGKLRRGISKKSNWIDVGSVVLVGFRDFQDGVVDIVHKYEQDDVNRLKKSGQLIEDNETRQTREEILQEDTGFDFENL